MDNRMVYCTCGYKWSNWRLWNDGWYWRPCLNPAKNCWQDYADGIFLTMCEIEAFESELELGEIVERAQIYFMNENSKIYENGVDENGEPMYNIEHIQFILPDSMKDQNTWLTRKDGIDFIFGW